MEDRQKEIQTCQQELAVLKERVRRLSVRLDRLEGKAEPAPQPTPVQQVQSKPQEVRAQEVKPRKPESKTEQQNLEGLVGRNLFAVLASVLVLLGVGVFISTIYEYIPEIVKIAAIYALGFAMLSVGLAIYRKNGNKFWLGVASCGLAELLVSVITSHTYFQVISLPWTFVLVLCWILGSFWLTRFQPTVFKTIGYCGLIISMQLGLSLVNRGDTATYMVLAGAFLLLAAFFMATHREKVKLNTVLALCSVLALTMFRDMPGYLAEVLDWLPVFWALGAMAIFHVIYLAVAKLHPKAYPIFAALSLWVGLLFVLPLGSEWVVAVMLTMIFGLWYLGQRCTAESGPRLIYALVAGLFLVATGIMSGMETWDKVWFLGAAAGGLILYWHTGHRDVAWLGLLAYAVVSFFCEFMTGETYWTFAGAVVFFALYSSPLVREDKTLRTGWYFLMLGLSWLLVDGILGKIYHANVDYRYTWDTVMAVYGAIVAVVNTAYLHLCMRDPEKILRLDLRSVLIMLPQALVLLLCLGYVDSRFWHVQMLGLAASLLVVSYSLYYSFKTNGRDRNLTVWQFIKFTLYCWYVLAALDSPDILVNIALMVIAVAAVALGFRLGQKAVRVYGLVLSLVDVVSLVLFRIDFSDSLQLAGGIMLCGLLCFVISFIYSRISRTAWNKDTAEPGV